MNLFTYLYSQFAAACQPKGSFFGFPTWYKYLDGQNVTDGATNTTTCSPIIHGINDVWLIVLAIIDLLLRAAILAAVGFVLAGGVKFMVSQGQPDKIKSALTTLVNALIGLAIAVAAATLVSYVAGKF
jgi:ABC-type Fe3+ transport system permease subunit